MQVDCRKLEKNTCNLASKITHNLRKLLTTQILLVYGFRNPPMCVGPLSNLGPDAP